jgi:tetratricopeptide (TPR) repeat protein
LGTLVGADAAGREPAAMAELARLCVGVPLALRVAAANLAGRDSVADYVAELRAGTRLAELAVDGDAAAAVRGAFDLSYATLDPDGRHVFRLLGVQPGPDVTPEAAAALADVPPREARRRLERLAAKHLVEPSAPGRYQFHDLLREYAAERAVEETRAPEREAARRRLFDHYVRSADAAGHLIEPIFLRMPRPEADTSLFDEADAANRWLDAERGNLLAVVRDAAEHGPRDIAWHLTDALRAWLWAGQMTTDWIGAAEAGLAAACEAGDRAAQAAMLHSLGMARSSAGDLTRSGRHLEEALGAFQEAGVPDGEIAALNNLASHHVRAGRIDRAVELFTRGLEISIRTGRHHYAASFEVNLGAAYEELDLGRADEHMRRALAITRHNGLTRLQGFALGNLASIAVRAGRFDMTLQYAQESIELYGRLGLDHLAVAVQQDTAQVWCARGELDEAADIAQTTYDQCVATGDRSREMDALLLLGIIGHRAGDEGAVAHFEQALVAAREIGHQAGEIEAHLGLGWWQNDRGDARPARENAVQSLELCQASGRRVLEGHARTLLAATLHTAGEHGAAYRQASAALDVHRVTGARPGEARTLLLLGSVVQTTDGVHAALPHWRRAHQLYAEMGMPDAAEVGDLLSRKESG